MNHAHACLLLFACSPILAQDAPPSASRPSSSDLGGGTHLTLWVGGDTMSSAQIRDASAEANTPAGGLAAMLAPLSALWTGPRHHVIVNLETPVTARRRRAHNEDAAAPGGARAVRLNAPTYFAEGLRRAGVDAVTVANNHALDQGEAGLEETLRHVEAAGLAVVGRHGRSLVVGGRHAVQVHNLYLVPGGIARGDGLAYYTGAPHMGAGLRHVVIVHVVGERIDEVEDAWRSAAHELANGGADAIIFHGTHVAMHAEELRTSRGAVPIAWGLGNMLTDMGRQASPRRAVSSKLSDPATRLGWLARVRIGPTFEMDLIPIFEIDDRFARWHGGAAAGEGEIRLWVHPLSGCSPFAALPARWPGDLRDEYDQWIGRQLIGTLERFHMARTCEQPMSVRLGP